MKPLMLLSKDVINEEEEGEEAQVSSRKTSVDLFDDSGIGNTVSSNTSAEEVGLKRNICIHEEKKEDEDDRNEPNSTKSSNVSQMLQVMKERLNLNLANPGQRSYSLNNSWLSFSNSLDIDDSIDEFNNISSEGGFEHFYKHYRNEEIQKELKLIKIHHQDGCYVIPSIKSIEMWFGVMFIRDGPYKDGIFHFTVYFPDDFPDARPILKFKSNVFHPQIKPKKGTLNLNPAYDKSKKPHVRTWELIKYARSCFYHLSTHDAYNTEAAYAFKTDLKKFKARCRSSVLDSLLEYEEQRHAFDFQSENPFRCSIVDDNLCEAIKNALVSNERQYDERYGLFGWAKSQLGKVLNNINTYSSGTDQQEEPSLPRLIENTKHQ